jgi:hypothetical protein
VLVAHRRLLHRDRDSPARAVSLAVRVWWSRTTLDRELAEGANPTTDPARGLRARQLSSPRYRRNLAAGLRKMVKEAREPAQLPWAAAVPLNRRQVLEAGELLQLLALRLETVDEPCPRAVALASFLISDPASPAIQLFDESDERLGAADRATAAQLARDALEAIACRPLR